MKTDTIPGPARTLLLGTVLGGVLALASFPHVFLTCAAFVDLWDQHAEPDVVWFLHYDASEVYRIAFVVSHLWLGWAISVWRQGETRLAFRSIVVVIAIELALVYLTVPWLRSRGFELDFF